MSGAPGLRREPAGSGAGWRLERWCFRGVAGDVVTADLTMPAVGEPWGVVLAAHGMGGSRDAPYVEGAARAWARDGLAMLSVDAPHHGDRRGPDPIDLASVSPDGLFAQSVGDLERALETLRETELGALPVGFLGFSLGAITGTALLARGTAIRAAVLVVAGSTATGTGGPEPSGGQEVAEALDPAAAAATVRGTAVLMVNADRDEVFDRASALALYDAFVGRKQIVFFPGTHAEWSEPALRYRTMLAFLRDELRP